MWKVDIYLENAGKSVKRKKGWYGYVLAYQGQRFHTLEEFRETEDTKNERDVECSWKRYQGASHVRQWSTRNPSIYRELSAVWHTTGRMAG